MKKSEFYEKYWTVDGKPAPPLSESEKAILDCTFVSGCVVVHEPTGIMGASVEEVNWKLNKYYQKIIDKHLQFTHVMKALK